MRWYTRPALVIASCTSVLLFNPATQSSLSQIEPIQPDPANAPKIISIEFPAQIVPDGKAVQGKVNFEAPKADIYQAEFKILKAIDPKDGSDSRNRSELQDITYDPRIKGQSKGSFPFTIKTKIEQIVTIAITLSGESSGRGPSKEFSFTALIPSSVGTLKWSIQIGTSTASSPAIGSDGTIYIGSDDNKLYAINPNNNVKWTFRTSDDVDSSPAIGSDDVIYIGSNDGKVYALTPDGRQKWAFPTQDRVQSTAVIGNDGTIYVGSQDRRIYALNPEGSLKITFPLSGSIGNSSPTIGSDGTVYIGTVDGKIHAILSVSQNIASSPWPMFLNNPRHTGSAR